MRQRTHHSRFITHHCVGRRGGRPLRAFTLIELMVVIGIIGLLISIALPAFQNARRQANRTVTQQMLTTLDVGIESYRSDSKSGGTLPPSVCPDGPVRNPHAPGNVNDRAEQRFGGASLLAWALVGADLLGTPGFKDLNGDGAGWDSFGGWTNNTGTEPPGNSNAAFQLYSLDATGRPLHTRTGPYVEVSKLKLPRQVKNGNNIHYELNNLDTRPTMGSICFLDSFGSPILYYKANRGAPSMVDAGADTTIAEYRPPSGSGGSYAPTGIYNLRDNYLFTGYIDGNSQVEQGLDLGGGTDHPMGRLGPYWSGNLPNGWSDQLKLVKGSFAYRVWNQNVTATPRPHREDSYILISAGPDGRYGTGDDVANFPIED